MYTAVTRIQHGLGEEVVTFNPGDTLPVGVFTDQDFASLLSVGAITGNVSGYGTVASETWDDSDVSNEDGTDTSNESQEAPEPKKKA